MVQIAVSWKVLGSAIRRPHTVRNGNGRGRGDARGRGQSGASLARNDSLCRLLWVVGQWSWRFFHSCYRSHTNCWAKGGNSADSGLCHLRKPIAGIHLPTERGLEASNSVYVGIPAGHLHGCSLSGGDSRDSVSGTYGSVVDPDSPDPESPQGEVIRIRSEEHIEPRALLWFHGRNCCRLRNAGGCLL